MPAGNDLVSGREHHAGRAFALALAALATVPSLLSATSYLPMSDESLVDQAPVAAVLRLAAGPPPVAAGDAAVTDYQMAVERVLKGSLPGSMVTVRVPGGPTPGGRTLQIWGAPRFAPGERVLLFLALRPDGRYGILHLMLGAFHEVRVGSRRLALRDLGETQALTAGGGVAAREPARDFAGFARWIARRAAGLRPRPLYLVDLPPDQARVVERFTYLGGAKYRWFEFDAAQSVSVFAHQDGQPGLAGGGFTEFQAAIAAWNDDPSSHVLYQYDGTTAADGGFTVFDDVNAILFDDRNGDIAGGFSCSSPGVGSGVLAIGGAWSSGTQQGGAFVIEGADIVVNDGAGCWFVTAKRAEQVYGHELGHTLGLGHSCGDGSSGSCDTTAKREALMRANAHADNRGASLNVDDRAGIRSLYPAPYSFFTLTPCRLVDTRNPAGPFGGPALASGFARAFTVGGNCGVPATAGAVAVNVTVAGATGAGHLTLYSADIPAPNTSAISFSAGQVRANNAVLLLSAETAGRITVLPNLTGNGEVHLILDLYGYFQ